MSIQSIEPWIEKSRYQDLIAFTSTFYKDDVEWRVRSEAFFEMIENAWKLGVHVIVWDGDSGPEFLSRVATYPHVTLVHSGRWWENFDLTMAGERRFTGKIALEKYPNASYFLWLEPEKVNLMVERNLDAILGPLRSWTADIVVPSRINKDTLPPQQKAAENRANRRAVNIVQTSHMGKAKDIHDQWVYAWFDRNYHASVYEDPYSGTREWYQEESPDIILGEGYGNARGFDLWFWPKAFTRKSMEEDFLSYKWAKWDGIITSVLAGKIRWKEVIDVPVDFTYPPKQTELETDPYQAARYQKLRRSQYRYIIKTIRDMVNNISHPEFVFGRVIEVIRAGNSEWLIRIMNSFPLHLAHQDNRRMIEEYNGKDFSVQRVTVYDDTRWLWNHFHLKWDQNISEVFVIESWKWSVVLQNIDESWEPFGDKEVIDLKKWDVVAILPYQAHTFFLDPGSIMRWFRPYPFDENNKDINSYKLEPSIE